MELKLITRLKLYLITRILKNRYPNYDYVAVVHVNIGREGTAHSFIKDWLAQDMPVRLIGKGAPGYISNWILKITTMIDTYSEALQDNPDMKLRDFEKMARENFDNKIKQRREEEEILNAAYRKR